MYNFSLAFPVDDTSFNTTFFEFNKTFSSLIDSLDNSSNVYAFPFESFTLVVITLFIKFAFPSDILFVLAKFSILSSLLYICDNIEPCMLLALNNSFISFDIFSSNSFAFSELSFFTDTNIEFCASVI